MKKFVLIMLIASIALWGGSQTTTELNLGSIFEKYGVSGCFVLYDQEENSYMKFNSGLCDSGYIPASTFKIPNSIIALEEGVIRDTSEIIKWDGHEWSGNKYWNQDQTLRTAMKYSCIWVYFNFAEKIGIDKYFRYVKDFDYGNKDLTGPPTRFWLSGSFKISANQQIEFLRRFYNYELPVADKSIDIVKDIIVLEKTASYTLSGKTGGGILSPSDFIMWLVGYIEKEDKIYFYALNFETDKVEETKEARYNILMDILKELKLVD